MNHYEQQYFRLFAAIANAIEALESNRYILAKEILICAEQAAEEAYLASHR
ncbi:MAG: hypothetical protein HFG44_05720 [Oscillospiraceae bacterium]|nr:hypothetical protein [Oscillospiraceae bacterium]